MNPPTDSHTPEASAYASARYKPLPRVLGAVQHRFMERCRRILERAFLEAEDALQEVSIGSRGRAALEAIEQLRAYRNAMMRGFAEALGLKFNEILQASAAKQAAAEIAAKLHLDVVEGEAFSAFQRLKDSAVKLRRYHQTNLAMANKRINHLVLQVEVNEVNSPLEPASIIDTFIRFADSRSLSRQAKETLIRQFEVQLERKLGPCYAEVNQVLVDARILPEAELQPAKPGEPGPGRPASSKPTQSSARPPTPVSKGPMAKDQAVGESQAKAPKQAVLRRELDESTIPVLDDKVEDTPRRRVDNPQRRVEPVRQPASKQVKPKPPTLPPREIQAQRAVVSAERSVEPKEVAPAKPESAPASQTPGVHKPDPRQRHSPPNCAVPGRTNLPLRETTAKPPAVQKPRTPSKPSAYQLEILEFYRKRPIMSAPDLSFDEPHARPTTAYLGENPERDKVMAMCTELFDELRNDDEVPAAVRQKLLALRVVFTAYAVNRNPHFLTQPESPARCLLELLWDLGRALQDSPTLPYHIIFIQIGEAVESLLIPSLAHDKDFFREYRKILARHY